MSDSGVLDGRHDGHGRGQGHPWSWQPQKADIKVTYLSTWVEIDHQDRPRVSLRKPLRLICQRRLGLKPLTTPLFSVASFRMPSRVCMVSNGHCVFIGHFPLQNWQKKAHGEV